MKKTTKKEPLFFKGISELLSAGTLTSVDNSSLKSCYPKLDFFTNSEIKKIENIIGHKIKNTAIFEQAFTHASYITVLKQKNVTVVSNERLEFLGDSILQFIISDYLFVNYPNENEGFLTKVRSELVNKNILSNITIEIGLYEFLHASFGSLNNEIGNKKMMSNVFEAVLGAIYLDVGLKKAVNFVYKYLIPKIQSDDFWVEKNYKSILLESFQAEGKEIPQYKVISSTGQDHDKDWVIGVYSDDVLLGTGAAKSIKAASQLASKDALILITKDKP